jgi:phage terminase small subunit
MADRSGAEHEDRKLTKQQEAFVLHFTSSPGAIGNATESARRAGYSEQSANELGYQLLQKPHVRNAILEANRRSISGPLATKAVDLLERVLDDEEAPIKVRVEAAKTVLDRAGVTSTIAERDDAQDRTAKSMSEMTREELEEVVRASKAVIEQARNSTAH